MHPIRHWSGRLQSPVNTGFLPLKGTRDSSEGQRDRELTVSEMEGTQVYVTGWDGCPG